MVKAFSCSNLGFRGMSLALSTIDLDGSPLFIVYFTLVLILSICINVYVFVDKPLIEVSNICQNLK